jgi:hypothetical protein
MDKFYTFLLCLLNRAFNRQGRGWYLTGKSLMYYAVNNTIYGLKEIEINAVGNLDIFESMISRHDGCIKIDTGKFCISGCMIIVHPVSEIQAVVEDFPKDFDRVKMQCPVNMGEILDQADPDWTENVTRIPKIEAKNTFFTPSRRQNGYDFIGAMLECGKKVGIADRMFLGFGNVLGYALRHDFMPNDDDIDMCLMADSISQEQRHRYLLECKAAGLTEDRMRGPALVDSKYSWFSIGPLSPYHKNGVKSCNWFWFEHGGYLWHSKGSQWIGRAGLDKVSPTAKGIPASLFKGGFKMVKFGSVDVQVPKNIGKILDYWYKPWLIRKKEASAITTVLTMPSNDKKTWHIKRG